MQSSAAWSLVQIRVVRVEEVHKTFLLWHHQQLMRGHHSCLGLTMEHGFDGVLSCSPVL